MGIRPKDFWSMSLREWLFALEGYIEANSPDEKDLPLTKNSEAWATLMEHDKNARK